MPFTDQPRRILGRVIAAAALVAAPLVVGACGDDDESAGQSGATPSTAAPSESSTATSTTAPASEDYFAEKKYVGQQVTVTAAVDQVLDGRALVLNGARYGDDSLLVLAEQQKPDVAKGDIVTVTGTVRTFDFDEYRERYGLADATAYEIYADEEFLAAGQIQQAPVSATSTPTPEATPTPTK